MKHIIIVIIIIATYKITRNYRYSASSIIIIASAVSAGIWIIHAARLKAFKRAVLFLVDRYA